MSQLPAFVTALLDPGAYPHPVDRVDLVQTHISYVLLAGDYVYKFKKPVDFGFLDFTTLEKRAFYCGEEVRLNRRLCPEIYLGTVTVRQGAGGLILDLEGSAAGQVVEHGVRMKRMDASGMMGPMLRAGKVTPAHIDRIVNRLVPFYAAASGDPALAEFGRARAVAVNVLENFEQTESFVGSPALPRERFAAISGWAREFLAHEERFDQRVADGRIADCHGDLYSANICFGPGEEVYIFDCIEFNERFRYADVASDIAFLAMDLDFHGRDDLARHLVERYCGAAGDQGLVAMLDFYKCYRAYVRGKIGLFTAADPKVDEATRERCTADAGRYFELAARYAGAGS